MPARERLPGAHALVRRSETGVNAASATRDDVLPVETRVYVKRPLDDPPQKVVDYYKQLYASYNGTKPPLNDLRLYETVGPTVAAVDSSASLFDANGYTQRFEAVNGGAHTLSVLPCGFSLPSSFATAFYKTTGMTPSAFRRALE